MFPTLVELREAMERFAAGFDQRELSAAQCTEVVRVASEIERFAATVKALAATRAHWSDGDRSPAHALARETGTSVKEATDVLATAEKLGALPVLVRTWKASPDPDYAPKAERVIALCKRPPQGSVVISFDQMGPVSLRPRE